MAQIFHVDTTDLPPGFDVGDLIAGGTTGDALKTWIRGRLREGIPPPEERPAPVRAEPAPRPAEAKSPASASVDRDGGAKGVSVRREHSRPTVSAIERQSSPPVVMSQGNVAHLPEPDGLPEVDPELPPEFSDDALADSFARDLSDRLRFVAPWGRWLTWAGHVWEHDETLRSIDFARRICRHAANEVLVRPDLATKARSIASSIASMRTIGNVERLARSDLRHAARADQWDADPWALNTPGGVVNLQTGMVRPARKDDYCTKTTSVAPGGACPTWLEFLKVATDGDDELIGFMQRMAGYCLTGITREHAVFFVYGTGGNGKGTFLNTLQSILKDYAKGASMDMFVEQKFNSHPTDLAALMGARMVTAQETEEGKRWNESRLKAMSGGDTITARFMRQDEFTYVPQFKLVFAGNHKPNLRNVDEAIKRRLYMIPFTVTVPPEKRDRMLPEKLRAESGGILQWAIEGCVDWQDNMLAPPLRVVATTEEYFEEEDTLGQFFSECCEFDRTFRVQTSELFARYSRWCESMGEYVLPRKRWLNQLAHKGMQSKNIGGVMRIEGVRLKATISAGGPGMEMF